MSPRTGDAPSMTQTGSEKGYPPAVVLLLLVLFAPALVVSMCVHIALVIMELHPSLIVRYISGGIGYAFGLWATYAGTEWLGAPPSLAVLTTAAGGIAAICMQCAKPAS